MTLWQIVHHSPPLMLRIIQRTMVYPSYPGVGIRLHSISSCQHGDPTEAQTAVFYLLFFVKQLMTVTKIAARLTPIMA